MQRRSAATGRTARGKPSTADAAPARPYVPGNMQIYNSKYANMQMRARCPLGESGGAGRGGAGAARAGRGAGGVRACVRVRAWRSRGAPHGTGWNGTMCLKPLAPSPPWAWLSLPSGSPLPAARMRPRRFTPLVLPAPSHLALPCLWEGLPSHSCFCTSNQQLTAFSVQCLRETSCCSLEKSLPRACFASTQGDTSLEKKKIHWRLHLWS